MKNSLYPHLISAIKYLCLTAVLAGCASISIDYFELDKLFGEVNPPNRMVSSNSDIGQNYLNDIQPLIDKRCVVCHGCYDAPCQLKLSSPEGIERGASKDLVYNGTRMLGSEPTRLGIDATTTSEWRNKGFFNVLNDRNQTESINLERSLFYKFLQLKQQHPLPDDQILDNDFSLGLDRAQQCASIDEFSYFADDQPLWGMPYGLPALANSEHNKLIEWLKKGSPMAVESSLPKEIRSQVSQWESFLNKDSLKHQLSSRYIYEHLFLANIYFSNLPLFTQAKENEKPEHYFKLVRSSTPPPQPIKIIATRRPYDDPKTERVYYRLKPVNESIVAKSHMPYAFNQQRLDWMTRLFITPQYTVDTLPGYDPKIAANPLSTYKNIPMNSRYRFMLEEAEFTIMGFIKGPVCRGQVALNVIDDHFWVTFINPEQQSSTGYNEFLTEHKNNLRLPGEAQTNTEILKSWSKLSESHSQYLSDKSIAINNSFAQVKRPALDYLWDGDDTNPNAALTVFRHFDSSTVIKGLVGQVPKTAWVIDYPLLERIHYLLVAEFDVYGSIGHQLITRLYMDFLRMEGEFNFLTLLPQDERRRLVNYWYRDTNSSIKQHLFNYESKIVHNANISFQTEQPKIELFNMIKNKLRNVTSHKYDIYNTNIPFEYSALLSKINRIRGKQAHFLPELSFVTLTSNLGKQYVFTLIRNSGHSNISSLLLEERYLLPEEDYLTIVPGIIGSYPGALFKVNEIDLMKFINQISSLEDEDHYSALLDRFAIRRTNKDFWQHSDELHTWYNKNQPLEYGLLDYNRLENN